ncbi:MAG: hypothetical protein H3C43_03060 [Leptonema sp. (in: Bacteria)]|nr:hypothetical protein [Leptonema sp. (in: bacteria)]
MFKNLFIKILSLLHRPLATPIFIFLIVFSSLIAQPQPWSILERVCFSILPAFLVAMLSLILFRYLLQFNQIWVAFFSIFVWILILIDIGAGFIGWIFVFSVVVLVFIVLRFRYSSMLSAGMIVFAIFYGGFQIYQGEQYLYLRYLIQSQNQTGLNQITASFEDSTITLSDKNGKFKEIKIPSSLHLVRDTQETESFMGLSPLFVLSTSANGDVTALPMVAVLTVADDFPIELWNVRISSSLNDLKKEGRIGEPKHICGDNHCIETIWQYEDRFQAKEIQIGYRFHISETRFDRSHRLLIWFREPVVVGFPHHPIVLEFLKEISLE